MSNKLTLDDVLARLQVEKEQLAEVTDDTRVRGGLRADDGDCKCCCCHCHKAD